MGLLAAALSVEASAQTTVDDVAQIVICMREHACKRAVFAKTYDQNIGEKIIFVSKGKRYTFYWNGDVDHYSGKAQPKGKQFLSVWIQPDSSNNPSSTLGVMDDGLDGSANFGMVGMSKSDRFFQEANKRLNISGEGLEHRDYWQEQYDAAIKTARRQLIQ